MEKIKKNISRHIGWVALKLIMFIVNVFGSEKMYMFADYFGNIAYFLLIKHRRIAMNNLNMIYGDKMSFDEKKILTRRVFKHFAYLGVELVFSYNNDFQKTLDLITVEGEENLKNALKENKGVLMFGAHIGNFPFIGGKLNSMGYHLKSMIKEVADKRVDDLFRHMRVNLEDGESIMLNAASRDQAARKALYWLRGGNILSIYIDQKFRKGILVDFLGHPALTGTGVAVYALKTKAPVVPIFIVRNTDHTHKIIIEKPVKVERTGDKQKDILLNMTNFTKIIEKYVLKYPDQWFWLHRRWKR